MNVWEILVAIKGKPREEQLSLLEEMGISEELKKHLLSCFNDSGRLINGLGEVVNSVVI